MGELLHNLSLYLLTFWPIGAINCTLSCVLAFPVYSGPMHVPSTITGLVKYLRKLKNVKIPGQVLIRLFSMIFEATVQIS